MDELMTMNRPFEFRLLGEMELWAAGHLLDVGTPRLQAVLAALAVDAGRPVAIETLVDRVWDESPPAEARNVLYSYLSRGRRLLRQVSLAGAATMRIERRHAGYVLDIDPDLVDLHRFRRLMDKGRDPQCGDPDRAVAIAEALGLWRGSPLAGISGGWAAQVRDSWCRQRLDAAVLWAQIELRLGHPTAVITTLPDLVTEYPLVEPLETLLMRALHAAGRDAEALDRYAAIRQRLADELGTDPGPELRALFHAVLHGESPPSPRVVRAVASPAQLPADITGFAGRGDELHRLDGLLRAAGDRSTAVVISAVSGTAGVGKTALALHWAHQVAHKFPDGQLYVNLRGFDPGGAPLSPGEAVRGFLDALDVSPHRVPDGVDAQAALYRSLLAGRRMLVVLDNARDVEQVQPLLPGTPGCLVLVTSRNQLTSLITGQCARPLTLDLLTADEARELLAHRIGRDRIAAEPDAVNDIIARCARLPLALAIAAARAASRPHFPLHTLASELRESQRRLDTLADPDPRADVRAVFSWSYNTLNPDSARLFRLLGLHTGPDITAPTAASLTAIPLTQIRPLLAELTRAHLLIEHTTGRYAFHDLLRAYAAEQTQTYDATAERREATHRLLDHYLLTASTATHLLDPYQGDPLRMPPAQAGAVLEDFTDQNEATAWFAAEYSALVAAVNYAAHNSGFETYAWSLAWTLGEYSYRRGHWLKLADAFHTALCAAERVADQRGQAHAHRSLGITHHMQGRYGQANSHFQRALTLFGQLGDRGTQAVVLRNLGMVAEKLSGPRDALAHAQQALDLCQATGDQVGQARALNAVGWYHVALASHDRAVACLEQALTLLQGTHDRHGQAAAWDSLGYAHHHLGHHHQAIECYHHSLHLARDLGNRYFEATTLAHLGDTHHAAKDIEQAHSDWLHALEIFDELDHPDAEEIRAKLAEIQ